MGQVRAVPGTAPGVAHPQQIEKATVGIGEEIELRSDILPQLAQLVGSVNARRRDPNAALLKVFNVLLELDQLPSAKRSPVAPIKNQQGQLF